ncbi:hypothetical protein M409DRAFT_25384 [Zasmidium cellare ATCC 36951]|uniref:F-box domain-containing protein n=1 Tax=Zasmidium cellare ATCC 36951 TaxID=1080233 RepID=A0A6A6CBC9_ZASCE|nr:uncharacterized protein M409DRAFT_25384 [Zasmidium cellare ATCC 36951]KAF2164507.1 hypothetical protein M409DRAFT_25384 [Zasmidium cellare ATCC 36951]
MEQQNGALARPRVKLDIGGDYDQWWKDVYFALSAKHGKGLLVYCEPRRQSYLSHDEKENMEEGNFEASVIIYNHVSTSLLLRVPHRDRFLPRKLLAHLAVLSKPFRILDLPAELRFRIYEMYFAAVAPGPHNVLDDGLPMATTSVLPSLTKTCRQIRQESLSLFISSRTLDISLPVSEDESQALHNIDTVKLWAENCAKAYLRHLRAVNLSYHMSTFPGFDCNLSFTEHSGLQISLESDDAWIYANQKAEAKQKQLKEHAEKIEAERRVLDLKGESIVLALIRDPEVWVWSDDQGE